MEPDDLHNLSLHWRSAAVLMLLARLDRPAGESELAALLRISESTVRRHLRSLASGGLLTRQRKHNGYALSLAGWQVVYGVSVQSERKSGKTERNSAQSERFRGPTTTTAFNSRKEGFRRAVVVEEGESVQSERNSAKTERNSVQNERIHPILTIHSIWKKRRRLVGGREAELLDALQAANLAALRAEGLGSNRRVERVCRLPHVTPQYIAGQARRLRQERRFDARLLLHIIESGDPLPPTRQELDAQDRQRYTEGEYADIIEH